MKRSVSFIRLALCMLPACVMLIPEAALAAKRRACQNLEQHFAQVERGASTPEINNALFAATDKGCEKLARLALEHGASLEARDRLGAKPLSHAAASGQAELVALYLDRGAPIDARNLDGSTALYKAAETGRIEIVKLLVERGAKVDLPGRSGITPLAAAAYMDSEPIVAYLIVPRFDSVYEAFQTFMTFFQGPLLALLLLGMLSGRTTQWGGLAGMLIGVSVAVAMHSARFVLGPEWKIPYLWVAW
jgi:ankyrin repeat protein